MALPERLLAELRELITHYPDRRAALIPALHRCQEELGGWVSPEIMEECAELFGLEAVEVYGVASFYPMFRLSPPGKHVIGICRNISCDLRGAPEIVEQVCQLTGARVGGTSSDGRFTITLLECQGACASAPMLDLDGVYHENLDRQSVKQIIADTIGGGA